MSGFLASIAGATYAPPVPLAAVAFDGVDDYYSATGITSTATDGNYATVAITFYYDGSNGDFEAMLNLRLGPNDSNWGLVIGLAGGTKVRLIRVKNIGSDGGALYLDSAGDTALVTNGWNQVVFWHKGDSASVSNSRCWVNGVQQTLFADGTITNTASPYNWGHTSGQVWIGRHTTDMIGGTQPYFKGRYSQIYIHNGQTTAPSISSFWNTTTNLPLDLGTNGTATGLAQPLIYHYGNTATFPTNNGTGFSSYTLTQSGGVTDAAGPTYGTIPAVVTPTGVQFERASSEKVTVTSFSSNVTGRIQVASYWFKLSGSPSGDESILVALYNDGNGPILCELTGGNIRHYVHTGTGFTDLQHTPSPALTSGNWNHIITKNNTSGSGRRQVWLNGVRVLDAAAYSSSANTYGVGSTNTAANGYAIGASPNASRFWNGCIAQVYWYGGDIDIDANIAKFYDNGVVDMGSAGTTSGLPTPHIYHYGSTQATFDDVRGSLGGSSVTVTGTLATCS